VGSSLSMTYPLVYFIHGVHCLKGQVSGEPSNLKLALSLSLTAENEALKNSQLSLYGVLSKRYIIDI
jgi:hypothetical protein